MTVERIGEPRCGYLVGTAGLLGGFYFSPGPARCGGIKDGVVFEIGNDGCWVVSFDDLRAIYELACSARSNLSEPPK